MLSLIPSRSRAIPDDAFQVVCLANTKHRPFKGLRQLIAGMHLIEDPRVHLIHLGDYDEADYQLAQQGPAAAGFICSVCVRMPSIFCRVKMSASVPLSGMPPPAACVKLWLVRWLVS